LTLVNARRGRGPEVGTDPTWQPTTGAPTGSGSILPEPGPPPGKVAPIEDGRLGGRGSRNDPRRAFRVESAGRSDRLAFAPAVE